MSSRSTFSGLLCPVHSAVNEWANPKDGIQGTLSLGMKMRWLHTHTHIFHAVLLYKQRSGWRGKNIEGLGVGPGILPTTVGVHMLCDQW